MSESLDNFVRELDNIDRSRERVAVEAYEWLAVSDPELAHLAMQVFKTSDKAAFWLAREVFTLGNKVPLTLIAEGKRELVIDCLYRIEHGMLA